MKCCTFFGHREIYQPIDKELKEIIINLIEKENVTHFYVGNQGNFDAIVFKILKEIKLTYPTISYNVILAYIPKSPTDYDSTDILPEGIENIHPRFAISWRNKWMINNSDYVVTFVTHPWGGASKFKTLAEKQGKKVINLVL